MSHQKTLVLGHRQTSQSTACPCGLKVEAAGDAVDVEALSGEVEVGHELAFHGLEIDFLEADAAAGDEFVFADIIHAKTDSRFSIKDSVDFSPKREQILIYDS